MVAKKVGISYARNARSAFKKAWDKLKAGGDGGLAEEADDETAKKPSPTKAKTPRKRSLAKADDSSDEEDKQALLKKKAKPAAKKAGGQRKAEKKAPAKPKHAAVVKKEIKDDISAGEDGEPELTMAEAEDYFDQADDDVSEYHDPEEPKDDPEIRGEEVEKHAIVSGYGGNDDVINEGQENDEEYAAMLGITVEQYRGYAQEAHMAEQNDDEFQMPPPTPVAHYSDEEEI